MVIFKNKEQFSGYTEIDTELEFMVRRESAQKTKSLNHESNGIWTRALSDWKCNRRFSA
jgi:hypothetical protein